MALQRLAAVELQLVMQHCDLHSILFLARCSRQTLAAASDAFPWKHLPPVSVRSSSATAALTERICFSLLRHCSFALRLDHIATTCISSSDEVDPILSGVARIPRVLSLDATNRGGLLQGQLAWLLSQPSLHGLRELRACTSSLDGRCALLMVKDLQHLQSLYLLSLDAARSDVDRSGSGLLAMLPLLPALTDLRITGSSWGASDGLIHAGQCARLKRLALGHLPGSLWQRLLTSRGLRHLSELELSHARTLRPFHGADRVDWAACFSNLRYLTSLRLDTCFGVDGILAAVRAHCCTVMRSLFIRSSQLTDPADGQQGTAASEWTLHGSPLPSEYALRQLAASLHPDCALVLQLDPLEESSGDSAIAGDSSSALDLDAGAEAWHRVRRMFDAVQSARLQQMAARSAALSQHAAPEFLAS